MTFWTKEREDELKRRHFAGDSFSEIAIAVGCSRSAAGGKVTRLFGTAVTVPSPEEKARRDLLRLERIAQAARAKSAIHARKALRIVRNDLAEPDAIGPLEDFPDGLTTEACRFIAGDPAKPDWRCCGQKTSQSTPYCEHHLARVTGAAAHAYTSEKKIKNFARLVG